MGHDKEWIDTKEDVTSFTYNRQVPPGERERYVVITGGTTGGFVEGSYLCYPAKSSLGDYYGEMNNTLFQQWLTTYLLPALPEPSLQYLVLDNAPYHRQLTEDSQCPTTATNKAELIKWLEKLNIDIPNRATRRQLLFLCRQHRPQPQYVIENIVQEWGHQVVWLPLVTLNSTLLNTYGDVRSIMCAHLFVASLERTLTPELKKPGSYPL